MEKKLEKLLDANTKKEEKINNFAALLEELSNTDEKKKLLWKEIYQNAVSDRERASILFTEAYKTMGNSSADHISLGSIMSKYIERMSKSNEQIFRLAELLHKCELAEASVDPNDIFSKISE